MLDRTLQEKIITILADYPITSASIFGSTAKKSVHADSDIDILFDYNHKTKFSLFDMLEIQEKLQDKLGKDIDFVPVGGLKTSIKEEILSSAIKFYEKR
jgi:hypothetical protein